MATTHQKDNIVWIYTGTEASVLLLKARLEEAGITSLIKDDSSSAFLGVVPGVIDLYIEEKDVNAAKPIVDEFNLINNE